MTGPIFEVLAAVEASRRLVPTEVATLLRGIADELEREAP